MRAFVLNREQHLVLHEFSYLQKKKVFKIRALMICDSFLPSHRLLFANNDLVTIGLGYLFRNKML